MQRAKASYERIDEIENLPNDIETTYKIDGPPTGDIIFNIEQFNFPGNDEQGLYDMHFSVKQGSTLGICRTYRFWGKVH